MIEGLVVLMLLVVGGGAYVVALVLGSTPMSAKELAELRQAHAELSARIEKGRAQKWDAVMLHHMRHQLAEIDERIAKAAPLDRA